MLKFATFQITSAVLETPGMSRTASLTRQAHRAVFDYEPRPGFLYVRSRAISSRCNDNFDEFPAEEIKKAYKTFIGKPVFVNHHNDNHRRARGVIIDAALHEDRNPDGSPDTWAEVLMEVDAVRFPILAKAILAGEVDRTSMGTDVAYSICSACGNKATSPAEYCAHIPRMKGKRIYQVTAATGEREGVLVREKCFGLKFFENSLLVEEPADPTAYFLGVDDRGLKMSAGLATTAAKKCEYCDAPAVKEILHSEGMAYIPVCADHLDTGKADASRSTPNGHVDPRNIDAIRPITTQSAKTAMEQPRCKSCGEPVKYNGRTVGQPTDAYPEGLLNGWYHADSMRREHQATPHDDRSGSDQEASDRAAMDQARMHVRDRLSDGFRQVREVDDLERQFRMSTKKTADGSIPVSDGDRLFYQQMHEQGLRDKEMHDHMSTAVTDLSDPAALKAHMFAAHGWDESDLWRNSHPQDHPMMSPGTDDDRPLRHDEIRGAHEYEHEVEFPNDYPSTTLGNSHFHHTGMKTAHLHDESTDHWSESQVRQHLLDEHHLSPEEVADSLSARHERSPGHSDLDALHQEHQVQHDVSEEELGDAVDDIFRHFHGSIQAEAGSRDKVFTPEQRAARREAGQKWVRQHPVRIKHVVAHWDQATEDEKANGMSWYSDAHHLAKHVANDTGVPMHTMAGLLTTYSPQTHWATNMTTAARVARTKVPLGGPGDGVMASTHQKHAAHRLLQGEHYEDTFKGGAPKVRAFGHLIEHGGNKDPESPRVVIDRHAFSVAAGARCPDVAYEHSGLGGKRRYEEVSQVYHKAAKAISKKEGYKVEAHQVQAATWLVRQRLNEQHDRELSATAGSRQATISQGAIRKWQSYAAEHHPALLGKEPGTGYSMSTPDDVKHANHMENESQTMTKASAFVPTSEDLLDFTRVAYGEVKAPADVDTLRDEECPVCGERDSYDGNSCQQCGFDAPPQMFQDPDLDKAKSLDLRKDILQDAGTLPGSVTDGMTPGEQDANGGMPEEVPGSGVPGSDQVPVDPSMVDADGNVTPVTDPAQIAQQQMDMLQSGQPLTPDMLGPNGEVSMSPTLDPEAATGHFNQGGEPFTPGPNAPTEPGEPEGPEGVIDEDGEPVDPSEVDANGEVADGQEEFAPAREGEPGTPADGVADLQCPACGYQADAQQPTSVDMDDQALPAPGAGTMAGDVCPNCQQAQLLSVGEMEQMAGAPARA